MAACDRIFITDCYLHSNARQQCTDLRTMAIHKGSQDLRGRTKSKHCKQFVYKDGRSKVCTLASCSFDDTAKGKANHEYSVVKANITGRNSNWFNVEARERIGVLLLNLGGPETLDDVQPFLYNLFADPDIIRLPKLLKAFQQPLAKLISSVRAAKSKEGYAAIGGGSPLRKMTEDQAAALKEALTERNVFAKIYIGMRYWHPFTEEALEQIKRDQITKLVVLPLYPQYSISTSGSSLRLLEEIFRNDQYLGTLNHTVIPSWYQREGYVKAMAKLISQELKTFKQIDEVVIFFSAHGVPLTYVEEAGDPYKQEMEECVRLIMTELKRRGIHNNHALAYQSRVGPIEWLKPYTDDTIKELGAMGVKSLLTVPISFVSEHIETLEEIDMEYRMLAYASGIEEWGRVPALGCEDSFISDLADAVIEELQKFEAYETETENAMWTISRTLQQYFLRNGAATWMEWLSGGYELL